MASLVETPEYLLACNQVKSAENLALFNAANAGSASGVESALKKGAKPNYIHNPDEQKTSLHIAAENGYTAIAKILLENGAVVDAASGSTKNTALMLAAHSGNADTVALLLENGADVSASNCYGNTALHEATHDGNDEIVAMLLKAGAPVNAKNHKGSTPLAFFCYNQDAKTHEIGTAKLLLDNGADASSLDESGMTPLLVACTVGRSDLITLLMEYGACPTVQDGKGRTAEDIATFHGFEDLMVRFGHNSPSKRFGNRAF
jgi:uncharacterized protein